MILVRILVLLSALTLVACSHTGSPTQVVRRPIATLLSEADLHRACGRFDLAMPLYREVVRREPHNAKASAGMRVINAEVRVYRATYNRACNIL